MKDVSVRARGVHRQPDRFTHHTIGWTVNTPSVSSFLNAYRNCLNSSTNSVVERCKQSAGKKSSMYPACNRCWWGALSLSRRCQCHICCQGANSHDDTVPESLKKTQLARLQGGGCFFFSNWLSQGYCREWLDKMLYSITHISVTSKDTESRITARLLWSPSVTEPVLRKQRHWRHEADFQITVMSVNCMDVCPCEQRLQFVGCVSWTLSVPLVTSGRV